MPEPALKCENNAIFNQNYSKKLFISFKISYSCSFGFRGNLEFPDFLQKLLVDKKDYLYGLVGILLPILLPWEEVGNLRYCSIHV